MCMRLCIGRALQNLALNVADKGFSISVFNRTYEKTEAAVRRASKEGVWQGTRQHSREADRRCSAQRISGPTESACMQQICGMPHPFALVLALLHNLNYASRFVHAGLGEKLLGFQEVKDFIASIKKPRYDAMHRRQLVGSTAPRVGYEHQPGLRKCNWCIGTTMAAVVWHAAGAMQAQIWPPPFLAFGFPPIEPCTADGRPFQERHHPGQGRLSCGPDH